jgi:hypothetical protein
VEAIAGLAEQTWQTADGAQASKYFGHYRLVLITNYREFRLIGADVDGKAAEYEKYTFANDATAFWGMRKRPPMTMGSILPRMAEYISRARAYAATAAAFEKLPVIWTPQGASSGELANCTGSELRTAAISWTQDSAGKIAPSVRRASWSHRTRPAAFADPILPT